MLDATWVLFSEKKLDIRKSSGKIWILGKVFLWANWQFYATLGPKQSNKISKNQIEFIFCKFCMVIKHNNKTKIKQTESSKKSLYEWIGCLLQFPFQESVAMYLGIYLTSSLNIWIMNWKVSISNKYERYGIF